MRRFFFLFGVLLVGAAGAGRAAGPVDTTEWTTYRNDALGFEVKHPASWHGGEGHGTMETALIGGPVNAAGEHATVQFILQRGRNPEGLSIAAWYDAQLKQMKSVPPMKTLQTSLGGHPAVRREITGTFGRHFDFYTVLNKTDIFSASIIQDSPDAPLQELSGAVVGTVKFTK